MGMMNWTDGSPLARYRVVEMLASELGPGEQNATAVSGGVHVDPPLAAFVYHYGGAMKVLVVNRAKDTCCMALAGIRVGSLVRVRVLQSDGSPDRVRDFDTRLAPVKLSLTAFGVALATVKA